MRASRKHSQVHDCILVGFDFVPPAALIATNENLLLQCHEQFKTITIIKVIMSTTAVKLKC